MAGEGFYDANALQQIAINLFYGWGYNFYRVENQLRADDQLVRSQAAALLGQALSSIETAESDYRREFLPPPTRAKPFPDAAAVAAAKSLERLAQALSALKASFSHQPVPENDRMTQRYREEADTLQRLIAVDERLAGQCELLRTMVSQKDADTLLARMKDLDAGMEAIRGTLHSREAILLGRS